jgi:hypothetical protein
MAAIVGLLVGGLFLHASIMSQMGEGRVCRSYGTRSVLGKLRAGSGPLATAPSGVGCGAIRLQFLATYPELDSL